MPGIILFGIRSPLLPDYEETCARLGLQIAAAVRVDNLRSRRLDRSAPIELSDLDASHKSLPFVACAFSPQRRHELVTLATGKGLIPTEALVDPTAIIASSTRLGNGVFINSGVVIGAAGLIGEHVFINRSTNIGHHGFLGDFASIGPGVTIAGNVHVGNHSFIGAGSIILPGVRIGDGVVIAAGSVVKYEVSSGVLVAGNPAKVRRRQPSADMLGAVGEE